MTTKSLKIKPAPIRETSPSKLFDVDFEVAGSPCSVKAIGASATEVLEEYSKMKGVEWIVVTESPKTDTILM